MSENNYVSRPSVLNLALTHSNDRLFMLFLVCKLTGLIDWPWVWVLAPIWVPLIVAVVIGGFLIARVLDARQPKWQDVPE